MNPQGGVHGQSSQTPRNHGQISQELNLLFFALLALWLRQGGKRGTLTKKNTDLRFSSLLAGNGLLAATARQAHKE